MEDYRVLAVQAVKSMVTHYGWNDSAVKSLKSSKYKPISIRSVSHLISHFSLVNVLLLFIEAGLTNREAAQAIYDAALDHKYYLEMEEREKELDNYDF